MEESQNIKRVFWALSHHWLHILFQNWAPGKVIWGGSKTQTDMSRPTFPWGFPGNSAGKKSTCNVGDLSSILALERSPGEGNSYPLQYSGLENSMDSIVHGVSKSWTRLSNFHFSLFFTLPGSSTGKESTCNAGDPGLIPGSGRSLEKA